MSARVGQRLSWSTEPDGLCTLSLHGEPLNELGQASLDELEAFVLALEAGRTSGAIRALLIESAQPRGFCAGADLRALHERLAAAGGAAPLAAELREFLTRINAALSGLDQSPLASAAAVHGVCFGGGLELALCCDLIVADPTARFGFPELRLGLIPGFGGIARLRRALGSARPLDLLLTGRSLNAERAREAGLVSQVAGRGRAGEAARAALRQTLRVPAAAVAAAKRHAKPHPAAALAAELETFLELFAAPECAAALADFAARADPLPYLPRSS